MMEKNNNKGLIITVIVLLCIIIILLLGFMGFVICSNNGAGYFNFSTDKIIYDESYDNNTVSNIIINSDCGDITVKQSDSDKIRIAAHGANADNFKSENSNGTLTVESKSHNVINFSPLKNFRSISTDIDIYLPSDFYNSLEINSGYGDISAGTLSGEFEIHSDCGDIDIDYVNISKNSSITSDLGDIDINRTNDIKIDYETSLGECDVKSNNASSDIILTVKTDLGDIEINS